MTTHRMLFKQAHIVDPSNGIDGEMDLLVESGRIAALGNGLPAGDAAVIECEGYVLCPGLVDLHAHLRVPGFEYKETMTTGTAAAAAGGFTTVCCMPNTEPCLDTVDAIADLQSIIEREASVTVFPIAAISRDREGVEAVDYYALADAGVVGFSDDGVSTLDAQVMVEALLASREVNVPVMVHCEDPSMAHGSMNEGDISRRLGLSGIPSEAEELFLSRDIALAEETGGWLYALHVSTGAGAEMIEAAKRRGVHVTAEVMPHHLLLSDEWVAGDRTLCNVSEPPGSAGTPADPLTKVNPPLRTPNETRLVLEALKAGVYDVIATDHAPHALHEKKMGEFESAAMGLSGFEFALPLVLSLVRAGHLTLFRLVELMSTRPAEIMGFDAGTLTPGAQADLTIFDPEETWAVIESELLTKSPNTPLLGMELCGRVKATYVKGVEQFERWS